MNLIFASICLMSCTQQYPQYPLTAQLGNGEKFTGTLTPAFFHEQSTINIASLDETTHCYGLARVASPSGF